MLSTFEGALLDRHLRGCASCRAFAEGVSVQARLLRSAPFEELTRPVDVPSLPARRLRRGAVGALSACAAAAVAAFVLVSPASQDRSRSAARASQASSPNLVVFPMSPSPGSAVEVPRIRVAPATFGDGPVHGYFSTPAF